MSKPFTSMFDMQILSKKKNNNIIIERKTIANGRSHCYFKYIVYMYTIQSDAERARAEAASLQEKLEKSQGEVYRLKAKLENAQGEQESLRQEMERVQSSVQRVHADRDKVSPFFSKSILSCYLSILYQQKSNKTNQK